MLGRIFFLLTKPSDSPCPLLFRISDCHDEKTYIYIYIWIYHDISRIIVLFDYLIVIAQTMMIYKLQL